MGDILHTMKPWKPFTGFAVSCVLLAWASYAPGTDLSRGILLLGAAWAAWRSVGGPAPSPSNLNTKPSNPATPAWVWGLILPVALLLRLYRLTTLSAWPCSDETEYASFALDVADHGRYQVLYTFAQAPPLYVWLEGFWFRLLGSSLTTLWLLPALLGTGTVAAAFWAAKQWTENTPAWILAILAATGFWPLYISRFSFNICLLLAFEWLLAGCFGRILRDRSDRLGWYVFAGILTGLGFWVASLWPLVALLGLILVLKERQRPAQGAVFLSAAAILALPFFFLALREGYGSHLINLLHSQHPHHPLNLKTLILYLFSIFTGLAPDIWYYNPVRGGLFNPVSGATALLGAALLIRTFRTSTSRWILFMLTTGLLPTLFTEGTDVFRITHILPYALLAAAVGMHKLSLPVPRKHRMLWILLFLSSSAAFDFAHLQAYHQRWGQPNPAWTHLKLQEEYQAYLRLKTQCETQGPGWILPLLTQQDGLRVAAAPFNLLRKSSADPSAARWAGIVVNVHLLPFLKTRFPDAELFDLSSPSSRWPFSWGLIILPINETRRPMLERWRLADQAARQARSAKDIEALAPLFKGDRFLQSCYQENLLGHYLLEQDIPQAEKALENALRDGYPAAHFLNQMGVLNIQRGNRQAGRALFKQALKSPVNYTSASQNLTRQDLPGSQQDKTVPSEK
jgi:4-amino-4-deoxy-L-arabinose transferase-like glycosyltransferase